MLYQLPLILLTSEVGAPNSPASLGGNVATPSIEASPPSTSVPLTTDETGRVENGKSGRRI